MPHDRNKTPLAVGDLVTIEAEITHLHQDENNSNMTVRTTAGMPPGGGKSYFTINSAQSEKVVAKSGSKLAAATAIILALFALTFSAGAQTTNAENVLGPTSSTLWDFVTTGSNYWAAPYTTYGVSSHTAGGGVALGYHISEVVNPVLRLDYFDGSFWMPSLTAQLQAPRTLMGKIPVIPFGIAGLATPISGAGAGNGSLVTIIGAGAAVKLDFLGGSKFLQHTDIVADYEKWIGLPQKEQNQIRVGLLFKF